MKPTKLTPRQKSVLLYGRAATNLVGRGFVNAAEEYDAWIQHRDELLAESGASRPWAYHHYELCPQTPQWIIDTEKMLHRRMVALVASEERASLAADQSPDLHNDFLTPESVRERQLLPETLEAVLREVGTAAAWHMFQDRELLAGKYLQISGAIREVLRGQLAMLTPPSAAN